MNDSRAQFEAWARVHVGQPSFEGRSAPRGQWVYRYPFMETYWQCWQYSRNLLMAELAELATKIEQEGKGERTQPDTSRP